MLLEIKKCGFYCVSMMLRATPITNATTNENPKLKVPCPRKNKFQRFTTTTLAIKATTKESKNFLKSNLSFILLY
jgi:hypothetical protein